MRVVDLVDDLELLRFPDLAGDPLALFQPDAAQGFHLLVIGHDLKIQPLGRRVDEKHARFLAVHEELGLVEDRLQDLGLVERRDNDGIDVDELVEFGDNPGGRRSAPGKRPSVFP
jgi:hypothetical protein